MCAWARRFPLAEADRPASHPGIARAGLDLLRRVVGLHQRRVPPGGDDGMMVEGTPTNGVYAWQMQYQSPRDLLWEVTFAGDLYVAVGDHARIVTSDDGGDWDIEALPLTNSISSTNTVFLCVGGNTNLLLAAGTSGSLAVSPNAFATVVLTNLDGTFSTNQASTLGVVWYSLPAPTTSDLAAVCAFSNNYFLAGANATLLRSANGTNWTTVSLPAAGTIDLSGLAASTNLMVAVGDQGLILTSPDGLNWTARVAHHQRALPGALPGRPLPGGR